MYQLTLTKEERKAIDWIGHRYSHGNILYSILVHYMPDTCESWSDGVTMTFNIPEHDAWRIQRIGEECNYRWDCFSAELAEKLTQFCLSLV